MKFHVLIIFRALELEKKNLENSGKILAGSRGSRDPCQIFETDLLAEALADFDTAGDVGAGQSVRVSSGRVLTSI